MTRDQYLDSPAHDLLRTVLIDARIATEIDANLLPVTAQFVTDESARQGKAIDGADVVTQIATGWCTRRAGRSWYTGELACQRRCGVSTGTT